MNFNDFRIFNTIYKLGSLNKVAKKLNCTQSNVTIRLQSLEQEVGQQLFIRTHKGVNPTKAGETLYPVLINIEAELNNVLTKINRKNQSLLGAKGLIDFVQFNNEINKDVPYGEIIVKEQGEIEIEASKNIYDTVITGIKLHKNKNYKLQKTDTIATNYLISPTVISLIDKIPVIIDSDPECIFRKQTLQSVQPNRQILEVDSIQIITNLIKQGKGMALLPSSISYHESLTKVKDEDINLPYYIYKSNL